MRWNRRKKLMFVTGGAGFLGRHLLGTDAARDWEIIAPPSRSLDVRDADAVITEITEWNPNAVVHLAYRKDDRRTIVGGSRNVAMGAAQAGARLIHLSTDIVFGGRPRPYTEADEPTPAIEYGRAKAEAEREVFRVHPNPLVIRTSLLYGTRVLAPTQTEIERVLRDGVAFTFFTDELRCPAHALDLATAISHLAEQPTVSGLLHLAGPEVLSRAEYAREMARWLGLDESRIHTSTIAESGQTRPASVILASTRAHTLGIAPFRTLREALT